MNLAIKIAAAIFSVPPDALALVLPMMAPPPRNAIEFDLRNEVDTALLGSCSSAANDKPLFAISEEEMNFVNCKTGLPSTDDTIYKSDVSETETETPPPSTYGEITSMGARQMFQKMGLMDHDATNREPKYQFFDLGSGGGRLVIQSHLELPSVYKSVGIELSPSRCKIASQTWENLVKSGEAHRLRKMAERSWGKVQTQKEGVQSSSTTSNHIIEPSVELVEGDLFTLDISQCTHMYVSSLCFTEDMLVRLVDKIEREGINLQIVVSIRALPLRKSSPLRKEDEQIKSDDARIKRKVVLGDKPWMEFLEMSWTRGRGDGCPVYFYAVKKA